MNMQLNTIENYSKKKTLLEKFKVLTYHEKNHLIINEISN